MEFACETFESVESSRQSQVKLVNSDMQTDPIMVKSAEVQAVIVKKSKQTQAEASEIDQTLVEEEDVRLDPTDPLFKIFLKKSIVIITEELKKTLSSHAFDDFVFENEIDDEASSISKLYVLTNLPRTAISLKKESEKGNESLKEVKSNVKSKATVSKKAEKVVKSSNLSTSSVSWNSSGNIVAVSYSSTAHSGFCEHISGFSCWNLVKRSFDCNSPDTDFETPCCVSALSFHPILPSVIAIGLYTGEIRIYDISLAVGEELVCASGMEDYTHNEPVNKIKWVSDPIVKNDYFLASVSGDGKLLYWSWSVGNVLLTPSYGSRIKPLHKSSTSFGHIGGTSFDVSNTVVIGTEGGHLFRSSLPVYKKKEGDWTIDAWRLIQDSQDREDIRKIVEKYAKINSVNSLTPSLLFSLVPATKIYPNAIQSSYTHHLSWISAVLRLYFYFIMCAAAIFSFSAQNLFKFIH